MHEVDLIGQGQLERGMFPGRLECSNQRAGERHLKRIVKVAFDTGGTAYLQREFSGFLALDTL